MFFSALSAPLRLRFINKGVHSVIGVLLIDKAKGPTSHDVVQAVRSITGQRRCGHTGTLDPFATGLLPICLGRATRLARFITGAVKTYRGLVRFGFATDTYDATGRSVGPTLEADLEPDQLREALKGFVGTQEQVPPPFAAKKIGGERMYRLARAGIAFQPRPVTVVIRRIDLLSTEKERAWLEVEAESGTYIRSLAHDLGQKLGLGAHLEELRRTRVGPFSVEQALSLEALREPGRPETALLGPSEALSEFPALNVGVEGAERVKHGRSVRASEGIDMPPELKAGQPCRMLGPEGVFLAVGMPDEEIQSIRPVVVLGN